MADDFRPNPAPTSRPSLQPLLVQSPHSARSSPSPLDSIVTKVALQEKKASEPSNVQLSVAPQEAQKVQESFIQAPVKPHTTPGDATPAQDRPAAPVFQPLALSRTLSDDTSGDSTAVTIISGQATRKGYGLSESDLQDDTSNLVVSPRSSTISPDGDIEIQVISPDSSAKGELVSDSFLVSSQVLQTQSPVFRELIDIVFNVHKGDSPSLNNNSQVLVLTEPMQLHVTDDPIGLLIVLLILHHKYRDIPKILTLDTMVKVAVVCETYMVYWPVLPTATLWRAKIDDSVVEATSEWLYLAWVFGWEREFEWITNELVPVLLLPKDDEDGLLRTDDGRILESYHSEKLCGS